jgi:hypothetical protein
MVGVVVIGPVRDDQVWLERADSIQQSLAQRHRVRDLAIGHLQAVKRRRDYPRCFSRFKDSAARQVFT